MKGPLKDNHFSDFEVESNYKQYDKNGNYQTWLNRDFLK